VQVAHGWNIRGRSIAINRGCGAMVTTLERPSRRSPCSPRRRETTANRRTLALGPCDKATSDRTGHPTSAAVFSAFGNDDRERWRKAWSKCCGRPVSARRTAVARREATAQIGSYGAAPSPAVTTTSR
jgi:hypothetical protein